MTQSPDPTPGRSIVVRWRMLAEQRLNHLIELYESGRWKRYHEEAEFLEMVQEARSALKVWQQLAPPDALYDKPVEVSLEQALIRMDGMPSQPPDALANGVVADHDLRKS